MFNSICALGFDDEQIEEIDRMVHAVPGMRKHPVYGLEVGQHLPAVFVSGQPLLLWKIQAGSSTIFRDTHDTRWLLSLFRGKPPWLAIVDPPDRQTLSICQAASAFGIFFDEPATSETIRNAIVHLKILAPQRSSRITIPKVLRLVHLWRGNIRLRVNVAPKREGWITIRDGEVCSATSNSGETGMQSLRQILSWPDGDLTPATPTDVTVVNITVPSRELLTREYFETLLGRTGESKPKTASEAKENKTLPAFQPRDTPGIERICSNVLGKLPDALGCWVVDLRSGCLTGTQQENSPCTAEYVVGVALNAQRAFGSPALERIRQLVGNPTPEGGYFANEAVFSSSELTQLMCPIENSHAVVVLVTRNTEDPQKSWIALRECITDLTATLCK